MIDRKTTVLLILVSAAIVLVSLLTKSYWGDEIWSITTARMETGAMAGALTEDYHPPLYFLLLKLWAHVFSLSEISLRIFQGVQTFLFLLGAYILGRKLVYARSGLAPFLLLCFSAELWLFAPMLRYYILAGTLTLFATYFFLVWTEKPINRNLWLPGIFYALLLYTDYPSSVIIGIHGLYLLLLRGELFFRFLKAPLAAIGVFLPWAAVVLLQVGKLLGAEHAADMNRSPSVILLKIAYSLYAFLVNETVYPFELMGIAALSCATVCVFVFRREVLEQLKSEVIISGLIIIGGLLFTSLLTTFISRHTSFIYTPSRTFYVLPFVSFMLGVVYYGIKKKPFRYLFLFSLLAVQFYGIFNLASNRHFLMPVYASPWKEILADLRGKSGLLAADEAMVYSYYAGYEPAKYPKLINTRGIIDTSVLRNHTGAVFVLISGRESTASQIDERGISYIVRNYEKGAAKEYLPIDESYRTLKKKVLKRDAYKAKFTLTEYPSRIAGVQNNPAP